MAQGTFLFVEKTIIILSWERYLPKKEVKGRRKKAEKKKKEWYKGIERKKSAQSTGKKRRKRIKVSPHLCKPRGNLAFVVINQYQVAYLLRISDEFLLYVKTCSRRLSPIGCRTLAQEKHDELDEHVHTDLHLYLDKRGHDARD